ncbi:MAG TPA: cell envelope integrity protein CreD [Flavitalea sp.]|nr:cell envelope integrity protein CreD [Flavitalea sp.]
MDTETKPDSFLSTFWERNRMLFKGFLIAILVLMLLIPTVLIQELIRERQGRQLQATEEVSSKWAAAQTIAGPVIGIPFMESVKDEKGNVEQVKQFAYFLPENLQVTGDLLPEERSRGIYKVIVYTSNLKLSGQFGKQDITSLGINPAAMIPSEAIIAFPVDDLRGIKEELRLTLNDSTYELIPGKVPGDVFGNIVLARINIGDMSQSKPFSLSLNLRGSKTLFFMPFGKTTRVSLASKWSDPKFDGNFLPDHSEVTAGGFRADWNVLYMNRNYPQQWIGTNPDIKSSAFGVELLVPVDAYLKSERSVKYAILCIVLTFTAFLMIELIYSKSIHPFQYILVGFALCIFYTLLISISEYLQFNTAYVISAIATIALITLYVRSVFQSARISGFIGLTLIFMYSFIYVLIQSQDYALLMGSIGLFLTLALVMYFSRKGKLN